MFVTEKRAYVSKRIETPSLLTLLRISCQYPVTNYPGAVPFLVAVAPWWCAADVIHYEFMVVKVLRGSPVQMLMMMMLAIFCSGYYHLTSLRLGHFISFIKDKTLPMAPL